ncbi:MAG: SNF2-related protein [Polyangiaceae bacterium]
MDAPISDDASWIGALEGHRLRQLLGSRTLDLALASKLVYDRVPRIVDSSVHAVVGDNAMSSVKVVLRSADEHSLDGSCSRCALAFGPCVHMGVVALDLALSAAMRSGLLAGEDIEPYAREAPAVRKAMLLERSFDNALAGWLVPTRSALDIEISAAPVPAADAPLVREYGERGAPVAQQSIAISVRVVGERKLLPPSGITKLADFVPRDRKVLAYARDRGAGKKAAFAVGNEASLALEAMRHHGSIFAAGFRSRLDFRGGYARPSIRLGIPEAEGDPDPAPGYGAGAAPPRDAFDVLSAVWVTDGGGSIPFSKAHLFAGPFPYLWTHAGAIYRIAPDVDLDVALGLSQSPTLYVPRGRLKDAGAQLLRATRGRGVVLPSHETFGLPPVETPRIVLRLEGEPLAIRGNAFALYRGKEFALFEPESEQEPHALRDHDTEARARELLTQAGLNPIVRGETEEVDDDSPESTLFLTNENAIAFWRDGLPLLRSTQNPIVHVELTPRLALVRLGAPLAARVHVGLEGHWLKARLDFRADDLPVEMAVIQAAIAKKQRWVVLDDGALCRISSSIEALSKEAADVFEAHPDGRLPPHQLGRLDRWIEEHDGVVAEDALALQRRLRALTVATEPHMPSTLTATLRPYQKLGLSWLQFLDTLGAGGILADDMGLGKTITTLAYLLWKKETSGAQTSLVVCPTSVATNWLKEAERFTPKLKVVLLHGPARDLKRALKADIVVTTYAIMRRDADMLSTFRFRAVVLDEAQNIKNDSSATTRAAGRLDAEMRLALSGTPMENRLRELWSLASFANPGILGTARKFERYFERPIAADRDAAVASELRAILRPFLLRRTKSAVLQELPPKTEIDRVVSLTTTDKRMYDALALTLRETVKKDLSRKKAATSLSVFTALTRLRQMACDPRLVDTQLGGESVSGKREAFLELVRELVAEGRRALVFSQFVSLLTLWRRDLDAENIAYEYLDGATTHRDEVVGRFQDGSAPLFLISLKAGGAGLNLTAADTVIHCDPWWNPAVEDQATDRAYRIGQDKPVTVVRLVARGTIEEKILSLKARKRELTTAIVSDSAGALAGITAEDVQLLLGDSDDDDLVLDEDNPDEKGRPRKSDVLATATDILEPEYEQLVKLVQRWLIDSGCLESELASLLQVPHAFAVDIARGKPFPCSRATADNIRRRIRAYYDDNEASA